MFAQTQIKQFNSWIPLASRIIHITNMQDDKDNNEKLELNILKQT